MNNNQKLIWSIYIFVVLLSLFLLLIDGNLWKIFMNNDCDYYTKAPLEQGCIWGENITLDALLLIPAFILHKIWGIKNKS